MKRIKMRAWVVVHFLNKTLVEDLVDTVKATTYNNTCKDDIDRGVVPHRFHDLTNALEQLDIWNS